MNKKQEKIYNWLLEHPGYLKKSIFWIYSNLNSSKTVRCSEKDVRIALEAAKYHKKKEFFNNGDNFNKHIAPKIKIPTNKQIEDSAYKAAHTALKAYATIETVELPNIITSKKLDPNNVLWIPDLHAPFIRDGVLEFCKENQLRYNCGTVRFAGDIIDGHAWNYHEHDPDGKSVGDELEAARAQLIPWYKAFPQATVCMGNHDLLIQRKAKTIGLSKHFIKDFGEVIGAPKSWEFGLEFKQDDVIYKHGNVGDAFKVAKESRMSTCQGHFHAKTFVQWSVSEKDAIFGMQIGWGAERDSYAFDYGKSFANKPIISLGVVLDRGRTPIVKLMDL